MSLNEWKVTVERRYRISLWCLIAATCLAVASPVGGYLILVLSPQEAGINGLETLARAILWALGGWIVAGGIALVSLGFGMSCARERKRVLFWVVPLWLAAAYGLIAGVAQLTLWADEKRGFIPGGMLDDLTFLGGAWLVFASLLYLARWMITSVYGVRCRFFPWWSVPVWAAALMGVILLSA